MTFRVAHVVETTGNYGLITPDYRPIREARVEAHGAVMVFSQWSHETDWYCDFLMKSENGYVSFSHGKGDRTVAKRIAQPELAAEIERVFKSVPE